MPDTYIASFSWHGPEFEKKLRHDIGLRLRAAALLLEAEVIRSIRQPYPPASLPGNPPHTRRFQQGLLGSIFNEVDLKNLQAFVGSTMKHSLYLELGTSTMAPRPFLITALRKMLPKFRFVERSS